MLFSVGQRAEGSEQRAGGRAGRAGQQGAGGAGAGAGAGGRGQGAGGSGQGAGQGGAGGQGAGGAGPLPPLQGQGQGQGQGRAGQRAGQGEGVIPTPKGLVVLLGGLGVELVGKNSAKNLHFFCNPKFHLQKICTFSANILHFLQSKIPSANNLQFFCNPKFHLHFFCKNNLVSRPYMLSQEQIVINLGKSGEHCAVRCIQKHDK